MTDLHADSAEIGRFVSILFRYAEQGTYISLRAFDQFDRSVPPLLIRPVKVNGSFDALIEAASRAAEECARANDPNVFAPPVCTFSNPDHARGVDLANGLTLSVEIDDVDPDAARARLERLLGPVTLIVRSGSDWIDPATGQIMPKVHLHWRLSEPTTTEDEHDRLRQARALAAMLVGADPTGKPVVHPLRWPGSWNRKTTPRMATIWHQDDRAEINLTDALEALEDAVGAAGWTKAGVPPSSSEPEAALSLVRSALSVIPNLGADVHYDEWIRLGYAVHRATGGGPEGFTFWDNWSRLSDKYDAEETELAWRRIVAALSGKAPARTIGAGTIFYLAGLRGWTRPFPFAGREREGAEAEAETDAGHGPDKAGHDPDKSRLKFVWFDDMHANLNTADFVEGLLIEGAMSVTYGESNCGKTFLMADLALHVAMGRVWWGREIEQSGVIYCALEGSHGISNRIAAFRKYHDLAPSALPFAVIPSAINLLDPDADTQRLIDAIKEAAALILVPVRLVVIDTLSRAMAGGNENAPDDMGALVMNTDRIRQETGAHVNFVHHSGKDTAKGARGHSLLRAATDTEIEISRPDKDSPSTATVTKQRDLEIDGEWVFRLEKVELGKNKRGKMVTSCVVLPTDATDRPTQQYEVGGQAGVALNALRAAMASPESAELPPLSHLPKDMRGVHAEIWRRYFYEKMPTISPDARQKAFVRSLHFLSQKRIIGVSDPWVWLV